MIEMKRRSMIVILEDESRHVFDFPSPEKMDSALEQAFASAFHPARP